MTAMQLAELLRRKRWMGYGAAIALALIATGVRLIFLQQLHGYPFLTYLPAIVLAAFAAGIGPALVCAVASESLAFLLFVDPDAPSTFGPHPATAIFLFTLTCSMIGLLIDVAPGPHFLVGDACWHERSFQENLMPHWLPQRILFPDRHAYRQTLEGLHQLHLGGDDLVIVPAHCSATYERLVER